MDMLGFFTPKPLPVIQISSDREEIYKARYKVYAEELGQYPLNADRKLDDPTDAYNVYIEVRVKGDLAGFVAITPPGHTKAMEKHTPVIRTHPHAHEIRLLTVLKNYRRKGIALALMYGALRFVEACAGHRNALIEVCARDTLVPLYKKLGLHTADSFGIGKIQYVHMHGTCFDVRLAIGTRRPRVQWNLPMDRESFVPCVHGGIGMERLNIGSNTVHADVLDAWFPPAPRVREALRYAIDHKGIYTTPPASCLTLIDAIAASRGVHRSNLVLGAGSSDLIYRCFFAWLQPSSKVFLVGPTYAEYEHVLREIGCHVTVGKLHESLTQEYDLLIVMNPNNITGTYTNIIWDTLPAKRVWVDETYIDFHDSSLSLERHVNSMHNIIVCKSMSKAYALSGMRVGYVCAHPMHIEAIKRRTPPRIVGRLAQIAACEALIDAAYYKECYRLTRELRIEFTEFLTRNKWKIVPEATANFVLCEPPCAVDAMCEHAQRNNVMLRKMDEREIRIAIKDAASMNRIMDVLSSFRVMFT